MDFESLIKARKALDSLWRKADLRGRCWGPKHIDNPYACFNITFAVNNELVSISMTKDERLLIHEFRRTRETALGTKVKDILREQGLFF